MDCKVQVGFKGQLVIGVMGKVNPDLPDTDDIMFGGNLHVTLACHLGLH